MISVVISYCSNDEAFIEPLLSECKKFSHDIVVVSPNHFLDGEYDTNLKDLSQASVKHLIYPWEVDKDPKYWHNHSRFLGLQAATQDYILFLDADEIPNGDLMKGFLEEGHHLSVPIVTFECYWYFREPIYQAEQTERCGAIFHRGHITEELIYHSMERWSFELTQTPYIDKARHNNQIIMHHLSWVRTKEQMLKKVNSWAHKSDKHWVSLIHQEFEYPFKGRDFVHNYKFKEVSNIFNINIHGRQETTEPNTILA